MYRPTYVPYVHLRFFFAAFTEITIYKPDYFLPTAQKDMEN